MVFLYESVSVYSILASIECMCKQREVSVCKTKRHGRKQQVKTVKSKATLCKSGGESTVNCMFQYIQQAKKESTLAL